MNIDPNLLNELYNQLPSSTKEILLNPSANAIGKGLGSIFTIIFSPFVALGGITENKINNLIERVQNKAQEIPKQDQDNSKPGLLLKALEESKYSIDEEILREMFANLIVSGLNKRKNYALTPRYATVLAQIGASEAEILKMINDQSSPQIPISKITAVKRFPNKYMPEEYRILSDDYTACDTLEIKRIPRTSLSILTSLGILDYNPEIPMKDEEFQKRYNSINNFFKDNISNFNTELNEYESINYLCGNIMPTSFGLQLFEYIF